MYFCNFILCRLLFLYGIFVCTCNLETRQKFLVQTLPNLNIFLTFKVFWFFCRFQQLVLQSIWVAFFVPQKVLINHECTVTHRCMQNRKITLTLLKSVSIFKWTCIYHGCEVLVRVLAQSLPRLPVTPWLYTEPSITKLVHCCAPFNVFKEWRFSLESSFSTQSVLESESGCF